MIQWIIFELKATEGIRTPDLLITNQLLYRLSYSSIFEITKVFYHTSWKKSIKIHAQFIYFRGSGHYNKNIPHFNGERTE